MLRHSVSPRPSARSSAPIASACHAPRPVLRARRAPWGSRARSMVPPDPVLWPVLADPSRMYHRLSNPRWGCLVSTSAISDNRMRPSWTRMNGSTRSYGTDPDGSASRTGNPITRIDAAFSTCTASRPSLTSCSFMAPCSFPALG
jgi:hypothetical protein